MSRRYVVTHYGMISNVWVILDCKKDMYVKREQMNRFGCMAGAVWQFEHQESAQYHADTMNSEEADD